MVKAPVAHPMVMCGGAEPLMAPWCWWVCWAGKWRRKGLPHAFHCAPLVIMGSLSGHAGGCGAQGDFHPGKFNSESPNYVLGCV